MRTRKSKKNRADALAVSAKETGAQNAPVQKYERSEPFYEELLEFAVALANKLQACGAETYRVEETIVRIVKAYGVSKVDTFVIPTCIMASLETETQILTKIRRLKSGDTMLDGIERYSALCRKICAEKPDMKEARRQLLAVQASVCSYGSFIYYLAAFLIGAGFGVFFGGALLEALASGICGLAAGAALRFMGKLNANAFFKSFVCSFILAFIANALTAVGLCKNADIASIGALMILVPGFLFTNSLRDVIYGDTMSGINRLVQVLIIAVALVVGSSAAVSLARQLFSSIPTDLVPIDHPLAIQCLAGMIGTLGFALMFNMHGRGIPFALLGSVISWLVCSVLMRLGLSEPASYLIPAAVSGFYAEVMARIRKFPATSYLLAALVPLIPGAGVYYTMDFLRRGMGAEAYQKGMATAAIAGAMAVGVLLISTAFRMWGVWKKNRKKKAE